MQEEPEGDSDGAAVNQAVDYQTFLDLYKDQMLEEEIQELG